MLLSNASGCKCTYQVELLDLYMSSHVYSVVTKSCTLYKRIGNSHPRYFAEVQRNDVDNLDRAILSINSTGLANNGLEYYINVAKRIKTFRETGTIPDKKPYIISVAGLSFQEIYEMLSRLREDDVVGISGIELNLSCPNIEGKSQTGYDPDLVDHLLYRIFNDYQPKVALGLKLPPYLEKEKLKKVGDIICNYPIQFITCSNSLGNGLVLNKIGEPVIKPNNGLGGIGGKSLKPISLSNVYQFRKIFEKNNRPDIIIKGCGGITDIEDVIDYLNAGANEVQIGSQLCEEGIGCFERIQNEYSALQLIMST